MSKDEPPRVTIAELLGTKYRLEIDPADPLLLVADIVGEMQKEALDRLGAVVKEAADQIATSAVLAENSARARSGTIITDAARWRPSRSDLPEMMPASRQAGTLRFCSSGPSMPPGVRRSRLG